MLRVPLEEEGLRGLQMGNEGNDRQQLCAPSQEVHLKDSGQDKAGKSCEQRSTTAVNGENGPFRHQEGNEGKCQPSNH
jgi:hypothetical protein